MNVTLIGTGNMGSALAKLLSLAGHALTVTGRHFDKAQALAAAHPGAVAAHAETAAAEADVIIVATAFDDAVSALKALGDVRGKTVVDISNPLTADYMGLTIGHSTSAAEEIAKAFPGVDIVKAFNTVLAQVLAEGGDFGQGQTVPVFVASDSERAKQVVSALAASLGFAPVDAGALKNARYLEPLAGLNIYFAYGAGLGTHIAPAWLKKAES